MSDPTVEVPEAELRTILNTLAAADAMFGPAFAMIPSYPSACHAHAVLVALIQAGAGGMPPDPMSAADTGAVGQHEMMQSYVRAGFSEDQAFEVVMAYVRPAAAAMAMQMVQGHG